jgi:hydroxyacylglutathione hydrolase
MAPLRTLRDPLPSDAALIDPRAPHVFATGHRRGALNVVGNDSFAVRLGAVVPFGSPLVLLTTDRDQAELLRRQLATVGYDDVRGVADPVPDTGEDLGHVRVVDARIAKRMSDDGATLLDVRERSEYERAHAPGAMHIPYEQLSARIAEVPRGRDVIVYCAAGVRSSLAASILERSGLDPVNMRGGFSSWESAGLPTEG